MGHAGRIDGDSGEGLFQYLAGRFWGARVLRHPEGQGTDAYIDWPDLPDAGRLPVQVKSKASLSPRSNYLRLRASEIRGWATLRPILVLCELSTGHAWWLDTEETYIPSEPDSRFRLGFPLVNPLDETTRATVRRIALARARRMNGGGRRLPRRLKAATLDVLKGVIGETYQEIARRDIYDRDLVALALARFLHGSQLVVSNTDIDSLIEPMVERMSSKELGGRSHSLAALIAILFARADQPEPKTALAPELVKIAEHAVTSGDFVHAEFGLIIAAKLAEPKGSSNVDLLSSLLARASEKSRTERFQRIASLLSQWTREKGPLSRVFSRRMIGATVTRWTDQSLDVWDRESEARAVVDRILAVGPAGVTQDDLNLVDQWTRYRADRFLQHELGRYLF